MHAFALRLRRQFSALLVATSMVLALGCSGEGTLTLGEYAEWCSREPSKTLGTDGEGLVGLTWGELTEILGGLVEEMQVIEPPEDVRKYHAGQIQVMQAVVGFAQEQDEDELFNLFSLIGIGIVVSGISESAEASLTDQARAVLEEAGCLDSDDSGEGATSRIDRTNAAVIGDRITVHRMQDDDRFDLVVLGQPRYSDGYYRVPVRVFALTNEWAYDTSIWSNDQLELVSEPDSTGRIYKITDNVIFVDPPNDSLFNVILIAGGSYTGALYFRADDVPAGTKFVELRYPKDDSTNVVDLTR